MKNRFILWTTPLLLAPNLFAETYTVQQGDVLSRIVLKKYPNPEYRIYGLKGKIQEILRLNPQIKAPHLIYPDQVIILSEENSDVPLEEITPSQEEAPGLTATPNVISKGQWDLSAHYGLKYVSYGQDKALGSADVNSIFFNAVQFNAEYSRDDWAAWGYASTYKVKYVSGSVSDGRQISTYELGGSYKNYLATVSLDDSPLFKDTTGPVEMGRLSVLYLGVGLRHQWNLESSLLSFKSFLKYPLSANSSDSKITVSDTKGLKVKGQLQWQYPFYKTSSYELFADWQNDLSYQQLDQKVTWGNASGKSEMSIMEATSSIGIHLKY